MAPFDRRNNNHERQKDEDSPSILGVLFFGLIGATVTTVAAVRLRMSIDWFYNQLKSRSNSSWANGATTSKHGSAKWSRYNRRMQEEYEDEMERLVKDSYFQQMQYGAPNIDYKEYVAARANEPRLNQIDLEAAQESEPCYEVAYSKCGDKDAKAALKTEPRQAIPSCPIAIKASCYQNKMHQGSLQGYHNYHSFAMNNYSTFTGSPFSFRDNGLKSMNGKQLAAQYEEPRHDLFSNYSDKAKDNNFHMSATTMFSQRRKMNSVFQASYGSNIISSNYDLPALNSSPRSTEAVKRKYEHWLDNIKDMRIGNSWYQSYINNKVYPISVWCEGESSSNKEARTHDSPDLSKTHHQSANWNTDLESIASYQNRLSLRGGTKEDYSFCLQEKGALSKRHSIHEKIRVWKPP